MEMKTFKARDTHLLAIGISFFSVALLMLQLHPKFPVRICYAHEREHSQSWTMTNFTQLNALEDLSDQSNQRWISTVMPKNEGFISMRHNDTYNINWGISMFHQLHCLSLLRAILQREMSNQPKHGHSTERDKHHDEHFLHSSHLPHCVGYLAQVLTVPYNNSLLLPHL